MEIFGDHPVTSSPTSGCTLTASEKRVAPDRPLFTTLPRKNSASTISRCCALKNCCGQDGHTKKLIDKKSTPVAAAKKQKAVSHRRFHIALLKHALRCERCRQIRKNFQPTTEKKDKNSPLATYDRPCLCWCCWVTTWRVTCCSTLLNCCWVEVLCWTILLLVVDCCCWTWRFIFARSCDAR